MTVTCTGALRKARAARNPPNPAPTITTRGVIPGFFFALDSTFFGVLKIFVSAAFVVSCTSVILAPHIGISHSYLINSLQYEGKGNKPCPYFFYCAIVEQ